MARTKVRQKKKIKHIGFKAAAAKAAKGAGVSLKRGAAIIAAAGRKASAKAKRINPRLKKIKGKAKGKKK